MVSTGSNGGQGLLAGGRQISRSLILFLKPQFNYFLITIRDKDLERKDTSVAVYLSD